MLLALVMVVSLLPMSVLAAETTCPGYGEDHTLANSSNPVEVETVEPSGCTWGYTVYNCECGERFADDFVKPAGEHELEETKAPTCTEKGLKECKNCNYSEEIKALGHDWADKTVEEGECYVIKVCTRCGEQEIIEEDHVWSEHPTSIVAPNGCKDGEATYSCKNCDATHKVKVLAEEGHKLVDVAVVPATCTEDGVEAHQKCEVCGTLFLNGDEVEAEDLVIPAAHTPKTVETKLTVCKTQIDVICDVCGEALEESEVVANHGELITIGKSEATCTTWGHTLEACETCGELLTTNSVAPLGHVGYADGDNKEYVAPNCDKDGSKTWTCTRQIKDKDGNVVTCGAKCSEEIPSFGGHNIVAVEVPATCCTYGYTVYFCANYPCSKSVCEEDGKGFSWKTAISLDADKDGKEETYYFGADILRICGEKVYNKASNLNVYFHKIEVDVEGGFNPELHTEDPAKTAYINAPTCTEPGDKLWYCLGCPYYAVEAVPALGHDYDMENGQVTTKPTCTKDGVMTYTCTVNGCGATTTEAIPMLGHDLYGDIVTTDPTCAMEGYDWQACANENCAGVYSNPVAKVVYELGTYYKSYEEMAAIHENHGAPENYRKGDCLTIGLDKYFCDDCDTYVLVVTDNTGKGHVEPNWTGSFKVEMIKGLPIEIFNPGAGSHIGHYSGIDFIVPVAPTCTTAGTTGQYLCASCNQWVMNEEIPALGHKMTAFEEVPATCEKDGVKAYFHCETCDKNFVMDKDEKYVEVADADLIIPALGHDYVVIDERTVGCELYGYIHVLCANCNDEYIHKYVKETGHFMLGEQRLPTCTEDGFQNDYCINPGCKHKVEQILKAEGHTNEAGEHFWGFCTDAVVDNNCVVCGEVEQLHKNIVINNVPATCKDYAYTIKYCPDCDYYVVEEDTISGLGQHTWEGRGLDGWTTKVPATYHEGGVEERKCTVCGEYETRDTDPLLGMGLNMSVENAAVAGAAICDSSLIKITVTVDANDIDAWGYEFDVVYDDAALNFVYADFTGSAFDTNTAYTTAENAEGKVTVSASCVNTEGGRTQNININEEMFLVDLYFRVTHKGEGETALNIYTANFIDKTGADCVEDVAQAMVEVEIDEFLDITNDGDFNLVDVQTAYKILIGEELLVGIDEEGNEIYELVIYDATVDVDKDGEITLTDIQMLYDYLVANYEYEDMTEFGVEE